MYEHQITLCEELAKKDANGVGFAYEIHSIEHNPDRLLLCYEDEKGNFIQLRYRTSDVNYYIEHGTWIVVPGSKLEVAAE